MDGSPWLISILVSLKVSPKAQWIDSKVVSTHRTGTHPEKTFTKQAIFRDSFHSGRTGHCRTGVLYYRCVVIFLDWLAAKWYELTWNCLKLSTEQNQTKAQLLCCHRGLQWVILLLYCVPNMGFSRQRKLSNQIVTFTNLRLTKVIRFWFWMFMI